MHNGRQINEAFVQANAANASKRFDSVVSWKQEDYHGGHLTLLVEYENGARQWESWLWCCNELDPSLTIDRWRENGLSNKDLLRAIAALARCVECHPVDEKEPNRH